MFFKKKQNSDSFLKRQLVKKYDLTLPRKSGEKIYQFSKKTRLVSFLQLLKT